MKKKALRAVHDDDLVAFLRGLGVLADIEAGRLTCRYCGVAITVDSLEAVFPEQGDVRAVCSSPDCLSRFAQARFSR